MFVMWRLPGARVPGANNYLGQEWIDGGEVSVGSPGAPNLGIRDLFWAPKRGYGGIQTPFQQDTGGPVGGLNSHRPSS